MLYRFGVFLHMFLVCFWRDNPEWARASSFKRFLDHTQRRTAVCRITVDEWSVRRRDLYRKTQSTHNGQTPMPPLGFESGRAVADLRPLGPAFTHVYLPKSMAFM